MASQIVCYSHNLALHLNSSVHGYLFFKLPIIYAAPALKLYLFLGLLVRCAFLVYNCHSRTKISKQRTHESGFEVGTAYMI